MILKLLSNMSFYIPEALGILLMCTLLFMEAAYRPNENKRTFVFITALIGLSLMSASLICNLGVKPTALFQNAVVIDQFSTLIKLIMTLGTMGVLYMSNISKDIYDELKSEFIIMSIGVLIGGMLLASANNLLTVYLGIEMLSILSYVLTSFKRKDSISTEAGMKYALYGGITAGIMLFGISHIYGVLGTIQFSEIYTSVAALKGGDLYIVMTSFVLFFAGIGYKISCFPFHMWSPDVYQGAPIPVTSFFAIVPKVAGLAVLVRVTNVFFSGDSGMAHTWIGLLQVIAGLTMSVGNISAIGQDSIKRMLAFSSIGHVGMMLMGVVVINELGTSAIVFYAITYLFMTLVAFLITSHLSDKYGSDSMVSFKGLINKHPLMAIIMITVLFSLAGLPPLSGFIAKFNIISVVIKKGYTGLAFIAALNSCIALYYYMKVVKTMVFDKSEFNEQVESFNFVNQGVLCILCIPVVLLGIFWEGIMSISSGAKLFIIN